MAHRQSSPFSNLFPLLYFHTCTVQIPLPVFNPRSSPSTKKIICCFSLKRERQSVRARTTYYPEKQEEGVQSFFVVLFWRKRVLGSHDIRVLWTILFYAVHAYISCFVQQNNLTLRSAVVWMFKPRLYITALLLCLSLLFCQYAKHCMLLLSVGSLQIKSCTYNTRMSCTGSERAREIVCRQSNLSFESSIFRLWSHRPHRLLIYFSFAWNIDVWTLIQRTVSIIQINAVFHCLSVRIIISALFCQAVPRTWNQACRNFVVPQRKFYDFSIQNCNFWWFNLFLAIFQFFSPRFLRQAANIQWFKRFIDYAQSWVCLSWIADLTGWFASFFPPTSVHYCLHNSVVGVLFRQTTVEKEEKREGTVKRPGFSSKPVILVTHTFLWEFSITDLGKCIHTYVIAPFFHKIIGCIGPDPLLPLVIHVHLGFIPED